MTIRREEFDAALASLRELRDAVAQNAADLKIQFERIAQMQAQLDSDRRSDEKRPPRKKSTPSPTAAAADRPRERRSHPR